MYYRSYEPIPACDMENPGITKSIMTRENTITLYFSFFHILSVFSRCEKTLRTCEKYTHTHRSMFSEGLSEFHFIAVGREPSHEYFTCAVFVAFATLKEEEMVENINI